MVICLRTINEWAVNALQDAKHSTMINELNNLSLTDPGIDGFREVVGSGSTVVCKPSLINNHVGRVCVAS